jgi:serine/threonine protein kinase
MDSSPLMDCDIFDLASRVLDAFPEAIPIEDFGPYHLLEAIGEGGMGEVFLAEDKAAGRRVAIKFLRSVWSEPDLHRHFTREIQMLAKLEHPYIARLYEIGVHPNGTPYSVMEYVEGKPLDQYCRERECSLEVRVRLFHSVCNAVQYAHSRAVVHLDLKPSNILVKDDGTPMLLDFGIARRLENLDKPVDQTQLRFTPAFAAPEQIRREPVGTYTDVYALGVILYELLAGRHPYAVEGCSPSEIETIVIGEREPEKPSASAKHVTANKSAWNDLDVLCRRAMKKDIASRYPAVVELSQDIDHFLRGEPLKARPDKLSYRVGKFLRRNR